MDENAGKGGSNVQVRESRLRQRRFENSAITIIEILL